MKSSYESSCIGLITRCKDEYFISEFVEYYLTQGIDHIYIIDDDSLNKSIYDQLLDNADVTIIYGCNVTSTNFVNTIYVDIKNKFEWIIYVDVDEFITTRKNLSNTIKDELMTTFKNVDCIKIPWVIMGCNGAKKSPRRILATNIHRWNHDKKHPNPIHKFRCRYDEIEVKCIFKPKYFDAIWTHHPKKNNKENLRIVNGINCNATALSPFIKNLRETNIKHGYLLCYHYRIISIENCINKLKTNRWYMKNNYTLSDIMSFDHNEVEDSTLRDKWVELECDRSR